MAGHHDEHDHHVLPYRVYFGVFGALMVLTILTVLVSQWNLGAFSLPVAMAVAIVKAGLVIGFFMHLRYENRFLSLVFFSGILFMFFFFGFTMVDLMTRGAGNPEEAHFKARKDKKMLTYVSNPKNFKAAKKEQAAFVGWSKPKPVVYKTSAAVLAAGQKVYATNCAACHGKTGKGDGNKAGNPTNFVAGAYKHGGTLKSTIKIITKGAPGQPLMMAWGNILNKKQVQQVALYVLSLNAKEKKVVVDAVKKAAPKKAAPKKAAPAPAPRKAAPARVAPKAPAPTKAPAKPAVPTKPIK